MSTFIIWLAGLLSGGLLIVGAWADYDFRTGRFRDSNETFYVVLVLVLVIHAVLLPLAAWVGG